MTHFIKILLILTAVALSGCSQYAKVSISTPKFRPVGNMVGSFGAAEQKIAAALKLEKHDPLAAPGELLAATELASAHFLRGDGAHPV